MFRGIKAKATKLFRPKKYRAKKQEKLAKDAEKCHSSNDSVVHTLARSAFHIMSTSARIALKESPSELKLDVATELPATTTSQDCCNVTITAVMVHSVADLQSLPPAPSVVTVAEEINQTTNPVEELSERISDSSKSKEFTPSLPNPECGETNDMSLSSSGSFPDESSPPLSLFKKTSEEDLLALEEEEEEEEDVEEDVPVRESYQPATRMLLKEPHEPYHCSSPPQPSLPTSSLPPTSFIRSDTNQGTSLFGKLFNYFKSNNAPSACTPTQPSDESENLLLVARKSVCNTAFPHVVSRNSAQNSSTASTSEALSIWQGFVDLILHRDPGHREDDSNSKKHDDPSTTNQTTHNGNAQKTPSENHVEVKVSTKVLYLPDNASEWLLRRIVFVLNNSWSAMWQAYSDSSVAGARGGGRHRGNSFSILDETEKRPIPQSSASLPVTRANSPIRKRVMVSGLFILATAVAPFYDTLCRQAYSQLVDFLNTQVDYVSGAPADASSHWNFPSSAPRVSSLDCLRALSGASPLSSGPTVGSHISSWWRPSIEPGIEYLCSYRSSRLPTPSNKSRQSHPPVRM